MQNESPIYYTLLFVRCTCLTTNIVLLKIVTLTSTIKSCLLKRIFQ